MRQFCNQHNIKILKRKIVLHYVMISLLFTALVYGQGRTVRHTILTRNLIKEGYENVTARTSPRATLVQYEDSRNRYPTDGIQDVVGRTSLLLPPTSDKVVIVLLKYGVPLVVFENRNFAQYYNPRRRINMLIPRLSTSRKADLITSGMKSYPAFNRSGFKTDLIFHPDLRMALGNYNHPVESQFNIITEFRTLIYDGFLLSASAIVPVHNDFAEWENYIRLGPSSLNYITRLRRDYFIFVTAGYFRGNRYGVQAGLKKHLFDGGLVFDGRFGYSGYSIMDKGVIKYDYLKDVTWSLSALYFFKRRRLFTSIGFHRFLYKDHGLRFDAFRFFNEFQFGLWGVYADDSFNGGFQFSIPLPPRIYKPRRHFRPRIANYFDLAYQGKYNTTIGTTLKANDIFDDMFLRYNPQYLKSNLGRAQAQ